MIHVKCKYAQCEKRTELLVFNVQVLRFKNVQKFIQMSRKERLIFWEIIVSVILSKNVYMNMCPILNGFRDRAI
jgi:hypothetical protein